MNIEKGHLCATLFLLPLGLLATGGRAAEFDPSPVSSQVRSAIQAHWEAINTSDDTAVSRHHTENFRMIMPDFEAPFGLGDDAYGELTSTRTVRTLGDVHVEPLGRDVAVASFLMQGSMTWSDGRVDDRVRQVTEVWVREGDVWQEAHHHDSVYSPLPTVDPLAGAWEMVSLTDGSGKSLDPSGPGQLIFHDGRYSAVHTIDVVNRPLSAVAFNPTDEEKVAQYDTIIVNSGSYEISSDEVAMRPVVAKSPEYIGGTSTMSYEVAGDQLTLTMKSLESAEGEPAGGAQGTTLRLRRVE